MSPQIREEQQTEVPSRFTTHAVRCIEQSGEKAESEGGNRNREKQGLTIGPGPNGVFRSVRSRSKAGTRHHQRRRAPSRSRTGARQPEVHGQPRGETSWRADFNEVCPAGQAGLSTHRKKASVNQRPAANPQLKGETTPAPRSPLH